jgi:hypothetical protein
MSEAGKLIMVFSQTLLRLKPKATNDMARIPHFDKGGKENCLEI